MKPVVTVSATLGKAKHPRGGTMKNLEIMPEIERALFPLQSEELAALEASVLAEGIRDPLVVWRREGRLILVDGHHRYKIAQKHNLTFEVVEREFGCLEEVWAWVDMNQLGRRNLTDEQRALVRGRMYERMKRNRILNLKQYQAPKAQIDTSEDTAQNLAAKFGVGVATIKRDAAFTRAVELVQREAPEAAARILRGEVRDALTALPRLVELPPEVQRGAIQKIAASEANKISVAISMAKRENLVKQTRDFEDGDLYRLLCRDIRELVNELEPESVDAIVTDPPYSERYLALYEELAKLAARVLKPGGSLLVLTGQMYLPQVLQLMTPYISYHWVLSYQVPGANSKCWPQKVLIGWKPVLWFVRGTYQGRRIYDVVNSERRDKEFHEWGQSVSGMQALVERVSVPGALVLDPFVGGGATAVAAVTMGRRFIGSDVSPEAIAVTRARLRKERAAIPFRQHT